MCGEGKMSDLWNNNEPCRPDGCCEAEKGIELICEALRALNMGLEKIMCSNICGGIEFILFGLKKAEVGLSNIDEGLRRLLCDLGFDAFQNTSRGTDDICAGIYAGCRGLKAVLQGRREEGIAKIRTGIDLIERGLRRIFHSLRDIC